MGSEDIQKPTPPVCEEWNKLTLLNKEKDVIGIYISSHPLDEYELIIRSLCNSQVTDLDNLNELNGREVVIAGVVTSGEKDFVLFGKDYELFRPLLFKDYFLLVHGRVQPRPYGDTKQLEYKISTMQQLGEVRDNIKEVRLTVPIEEVTEPFIDTLATVVKKSRGKALLKLTLYDAREGVSVNLFSRKHKVALTPMLSKFIIGDDIKFSIG
mgnify:CR=1 FL=1